MKIEAYYNKTMETIVSKANAVRVDKDSLPLFLNEVVSKDTEKITKRFNKLRREYSGNFLMRLEVAMLSEEQDSALSRYMDYIASVKTAVEKALDDGKLVYALDDTDAEIAEVPVTAFFILESEAESTESLVGGSYAYDKEQGKVVIVPFKVSRLWGVFTNVINSREVYEYTASVTFEDYSNLISSTGRMSIREQVKNWMYWRDFYANTIISNTEALEKGETIEPNFVYYVPEKDDSNSGRYSSIKKDTIDKRLEHFNDEDGLGKFGVCADCGRLFRLTSKEISFFESKKLSLPKRCHSCRTGGQKLECCDCGKEFILRPKEIQFFENKGFALPKRCVDCRKAKRESKTK